jgi:uncharacterized protein YjeT (DUF2065 family)
MRKILLIITVLICTLFFSKEGKHAYLLYGDALGYYLYLPATFIYSNHKSLDSLPKDRQIGTFIFKYTKLMRDANATEKGYIVNQYTYGVAFMEMPFFLAAHAWEKLCGRPANGFSESYQHTLRLSGICYALLGLLLVYYSLATFFSPMTATLSAVVLILGTNLFWFTLYQAGMAHVPVFFLFSALIYCTIQLHRQRKGWQYALTGLICGMITVIRPVDMICVLIPVLYQVYDRQSLRAKIGLIKTDLWKTGLAAFCFILPIVPQLVYWKILSGHWIYDSYGSGQTFNFLHPQIWKGLFSASNGWLIYSPVMIFALAGLLLLWRYRSFALCLIVILPVYVWVIYSWYIYNYINGLGSRPMIHIYPLLAFPLAACIAFISTQQKLVKSMGFLLLLLQTSVNISYSVQQANGSLYSENSNYAFNWQTLFRYRLNYNDLVVYDVGHPQPDPDKLKLVRSLPCSVPSDTLNGVEKDRTGAIYYPVKREEYPPFQIEMIYQKDMNTICWAKCSGIFYAPEVVEDIYRNMLLVFDIRRGNEFTHWESMRINNKIGMTGKSNLRLFRPIAGEWGEAYYYARVPDNLQEGDVMRVMIWNIGHNQMWIKELCLDFYN